MICNASKCFDCDSTILYAFCDACGIATCEKDAARFTEDDVEDIDWDYTDSKGILHIHFCWYNLGQDFHFVLEDMLKELKPEHENFTYKMILEYH